MQLEGETAGEFRNSIQRQQREETNSVEGTPAGGNEAELCDNRDHH
ncbi:MAG: hypothetical protein QXW80_04455 [Candidatus Micrarchaeia archaeon]